MGHMGDAWDVANAALFLASGRAKYITGAEIVVDGGLTLGFGAVANLVPIKSFELEPDLAADNLGTKQHKA